MLKVAVVGVSGTELGSTSAKLFDVVSERHQPIKQRIKRRFGVLISCNVVHVCATLFHQGRNISRLKLFVVKAQYIRSSGNQKELTTFNPSVALSTNLAPQDGYFIFNPVGTGFMF